MKAKTKFETMQTIEETLFANRKTKEKNARSNYPRTPLMGNNSTCITSFEEAIACM
jgi:hypothetical protein